MIGERRRPGLPAELLVRVATIWVGLGVLQLAAVLLSGWIAPHVQPGELGLPALASFAALGCILLLVGRLAYRLFDIETAGLACLACALAVPLLGVVRPVASDPAAWQVIALLLALNGLMAREPRHGAWAIGGALALSLAVSLDGAVVAATLLALLALRWLGNRAERDWLVHALLALTAASGAALVARWALGLPPGCGAMGWSHLAALGWMTACAGVLTLREPHPRPLTMTGFAVAMGGAGLILAWPQACAASSLWPADALLDPAQLLQAIGLPLLALMATLRLFGQSREWLRRWWGEYLVLLLVATVLAVARPAAAPAACALAALPLGWQVRGWLRAARNARRSSRRALALASMAIAAAPALPFTLLLSASPSIAGEAHR